MNKEVETLHSSWRARNVKSSFSVLCSMNLRGGANSACQFRGPRGTTTYSINQGSNIDREFLYGSWNI